MKGFRLLIICLAFVLPSAVTLKAQSAASVKKDNSYIYAEGVAKDAGTADSLALEQLVTKLSQSVELPYSENVKVAVLRTYLPDLRRECGMIPVAGKNGSSVLRYVLRTDVGRIFDNRRRKVEEMLSIAGGAETKRQMDVALRYYSWAGTLMRSLPPLDVARIAEAKSREEAVLKGLSVKFDRRNVFDKGLVELLFSFDGQAVRSIDYRFYDGRKWSGVLSAKDGRGFIEVSPDSKIEDYRISYEITPAHLQHLFREVGEVGKALSGLEEVSVKVDTGNAVGKDTGNDSAKSTEKVVRTGMPARRSEPRKIDFSEVKKKVLDVMSRQEFTSAADTVSGHGITPVLYTSDYEDIIGRVCDNLVSGGRSGDVSDCFTAEGLDIFNRLLRYGGARVLNYDSLEFYSLDGDVFCRSVPMVFTFGGNSRRFVENVVFTFGKDKKISDITFSLGKETVQDIASQEGWTEEARIILVSFLENYKTAYALKRRDYIGSIFDDDALIITGRVLKNVKGADEYSGNRFVTLTRHNKETYLRQLDKVFASQEFINLQFSDCEVIKLGKGEQLFGIKIRQEYFSTTYSDSGYLFILVDLRDYRAPVIHVRTWQDAPDKEFGVIGPYNF
jgi:hypothetical protein